MFNGMYAAASAADAAEQYQLIVSQNLSHVNTPGYRRQLMSFQRLLKENENPGLHGAKISRTITDFSPGKYQRTERPLDIVIDGDAFFELDTPDGPRYTRNGAFFIGKNGELVTSNGTTVAGRNGPIRMPPNATADQIKVIDDGSIFVNGNQTGKIKVVAFEDNSRLQRQGHIGFKAPLDLQQKREPEVIVRQGYREMSNVSATQELIKLLAGVRHHEAAQRALRSMAESLQQRTRGE